MAMLLLEGCHVYNNCLAHVVLKDVVYIIIAYLYIVHDAYTMHISYLYICFISILLLEGSFFFVAGVYCFH